MSLFRDYDSEAKTHFNAGRMFEACQAALCADSSDVWIQYILGTCYRKGSGVERDFSKAFQWFRKSAEQGCSRAMFRIAFMCHNGEGVTRDDEKFFGCLKEAAAAGLAEAQWNLALCFRDGVGCEKDEKECNRWLRAAADGGNLDAIHYLQSNAYCCVSGETSRPEQVGRVFVSYSSKDRTVAASLVEHLERKGVACWIAPRNIPPGAEYAELVMQLTQPIPYLVCRRR